MKCTPQNRITLCASFGGDARELEGVAGVVGGVLHLGALVVVGEDHDVALVGEAAQFFLECVQLGHRVTGGRSAGGRARRLAWGPDYTLAPRLAGAPSAVRELAALRDSTSRFTSTPTSRAMLSSQAQTRNATAAPRVP